MSRQPRHHHESAPPHAPGAPDARPGADQSGGRAGAGQPSLPFEASQAEAASGRPAPVDPEPADDPDTWEADDTPIAFALTAAGHRVVDAEGPPPLSVAPEPASDEDGCLDDPSDTRPSRARALRRAGLSTTAIADQLGVDELIVRAWIDDLPGAPAPSSHRRTLATGSPTPPPAIGDDQVGLQLVRAESCREAQARLADDPRFALGLGLVAGLRRPDGAGLTIATADERFAARIVTWLRTYVDIADTDVRVVLRLGRDVAGDRARDRWAAALQLPAERIGAARARGALGVDEVEALLRVVEPGLAATLAGWCDAVGAAGEDPAEAVSTF